MARRSPARPADTRITMMSGSDQWGHLAEPSEQAVMSRFSPLGHTPGRIDPDRLRIADGRGWVEYPRTLDLRHTR